MNIQTIPLDKLRLSPRNVRKTGNVDVADLSASIQAEGLLQNLVVTQAVDGFYEVEDGGRRLLALKALKGLARLATDSIPCIVVDAEQGLEAGLTANIIRQAMHPADEFTAFSQLALDGKPIDEIAARFGKPERYIQQRLKLANVAPEFFEMYRSGDKAMTLDHLMALANTEDHAAQRTAWADAPQYGRTPARIRDYLARGKVRGDTGIAKFVGIDDYLEAGGNIECDLFSDAVYFLDPKLLDAAAIVKLNEVVDQHLAAGWGWAEAHLNLSFEDRHRYGHHPRRSEGERGYATPDDKTRYEASDARLTVIDDIDADALSPQEDSALEAEADSLRAELDAIENRMIQVFPPDVMAQSGVLITIDYDGLAIEYARLKPNQNAGSSTNSPTATTEQKPTKKPELSEAVRTSLSAHRSEAAAVQIWRDPNLAFALLLQRLLATHESRYVEPNGVGVQLTAPADATKVADIHKFLRDQATEATRLINETIKKKPTLESLIALDNEQRLRLLAALVACSFSGIVGYEKGHAGVAAIHAITGFDMADHWTPATDGFLGRIHADLVTAAVTEARGKEAALQLNGLKKTDRIATAAKLLAGTGWLPKLLRGPGYVAPSSTTTQPDGAQPKLKSGRKAATKKPATKKATKESGK